MAACLRSLRRLLLVLLFALCFVSIVHAERLDTTLEKLLGKPVAWGLKETSGVDTDPLLLAWVRQIGGKVSARAPRQDIKYTFSILGSDVANALAAPGGYIFVTRGLIDTIESDDELAAILAHESAHVSKRHAIQQIGENAAFLILLNQVKGRHAGDIKTAAQVYNVLRTLQRSRSMEAQADENGLIYAYEAGYDPGGLPRFFERLAAGGREPGRLEQYFATHPSPRNRLQKAQADPLVRRDDPKLRETIAAGYESRGLPGAAAQVRRGSGDPLEVPVRPFSRLSEPAAAGRRSVSQRVDDQVRGLTSAYRAQRFGGQLQQLLLVNSQLDYRWLYVALRAYAVQMETENVYARTLRVLRTATPTYDALAAHADVPDPALSASSLRGRDEVQRAVERISAAPGPLARASQAALAVLADLNNPLYHLRGATAWVRYGTLEGLLRYAESELARADDASARAWRLLAMARIRRYEALLNMLAPEDDAARRARWADLLARRLGGRFPTTGPAGAATVQAALSVQLTRPIELVGAGREDTPWADWALRSGGIPENIATAMRLLALDMERETAAEDKR